jgi:hypothetical protein
VYIACRQLKVSVPGEGGKCKVLVIDPGQPVPGVETWGYPQIIAHLNMHLIKWVGEHESRAPHNAHKNIDFKMPEVFKRMAPRPEYPSLVPKQVTKEPQPVATQVAQGVVEQQVTAPTTQVDGVPQVSPSTTPTCGACDGKTFKTNSALKAHNKFKHPESTQTKAG